MGSQNNKNINTVRHFHNQLLGCWTMSCTESLKFSNSNTYNQKKKDTKQILPLLCNGKCPQEGNEFQEIQAK